jgi:hypothetical protein
MEGSQEHCRAKKVPEPRQGEGIRDMTLAWRGPGSQVKSRRQIGTGRQRSISRHKEKETCVLRETGKEAVFVEPCIASILV